MKNKYLKILDYNKITEILSTYCKTYIGKDNVSILTPNFNKEEVAEALYTTQEAIHLLHGIGNIPLSEIPNINLSLKTLESGGMLSSLALLNIAKFLKISREVKEYFNSSEFSNTVDYSRLRMLFEQIYTNKGIEDKIFSVIIDENLIADTASPKLNSLRREGKKIEEIIRRQLNSFIHSKTYSSYIMEPIITIRENRYVVPIKEEHRTQVKGFIHDISSSGSTVFIEPITIFELNNDITNLRIEEDIEIERILAELSSMLYEYTNHLSYNISLLGKLDIVFAKANYSSAIDGTFPKINEQKYINLIGARHPLIDNHDVIPIDISIGKDYSALVITGPNTGGKTVALKTTGLLLLMAYSGIFIPVEENSSIYIFDNIFADIGDEQSIQENLSTFSSHISNIIEITNKVTPQSLVLLDELGSGTDPIEGANLAISILKYFFDLGAISISTTHYQELKNYCLVSEGFENASFEFDLINLKPTYKLLIGVPGKSNAFAISKRLGLNDSILQMAYSLMEEDSISIEELIKSIYTQKLEIEQEKENIQKNSNQIETLRNSLEQKANSQKEKEQKIIEKAKKEAREILLSAKAEANSLIKELSSIEKSNSDSLTKANNIRNQLNTDLKEVSQDEGSLNLDAIKALNEKFSLKNSSINKSSSKNSKNNSSGNKVSNASSKRNNINRSSVTFTKNAKFKSQNISSEINVIGMNVDEATFVIDKYLDDCTIAKISPVRVVHGKGTGKLRDGIHKFLKTNPHVKSFRLGTFGEGEMGVTIVELK